MHATTLSNRALNRATLARQLLLARADLDVPAALEHLVGLQAQAPAPPYVGLWTRLEGFQGQDLSALIDGRAAARIPLMRSTIHLVTADDAVRLRTVLQHVLDRQVGGSYGRQLQGIERDAVVQAARAMLDGKPLTFSELGARLAERFPGRDPQALANAARAWLPLVQVPPRGLWRRSGAAAHLPADTWLERAVLTEPPLPASAIAASLDALVLRYLRAFGPASVMDAQKWSGLTRLGEAVDRLRPDLVVFHDERGRELLDLPDAPRPEADVPAPIRFLPEFDNLLLSHADRGRVIAPEHWGRVMRGGVIFGAVLIDGVVGGTWKMERKRGGAMLRVTPFSKLRAGDRRDLEEEGARLAGFLEPEADPTVAIARDAAAAT